MACPFPRFVSAPQTPQYLKGMESSKNSIRHVRSTLFSTRMLVFLVLSVVLIIWTFNPFSTPAKQDDKIPFSHDQINE